MYPSLFTYLGCHFKYRQTMSAIIASHHPRELPECYFSVNHHWQCVNLYLYLSSHVLFMATFYRKIMFSQSAVDFLAT